MFSSLLSNKSLMIRRFFTRNLSNSLNLSNFSTSSLYEVINHNHNNNDNKHEIIFNNVNELIKTNNSVGQTFAVIHLYGEQLLIHLNDIVAIKYSIPLDCGERIKLEKCLLFGNKNFTLIGRPILDRDLIQIEATIVEKTMTQTSMNMLHKPRKHGYKRYRFTREPITILRINTINICHRLNENQQQIN